MGKATSFIVSEKGYGGLQNWKHSVDNVSWECEVAVRKTLLKII